MNFQLDFRMGIALFLVLTLSGVSLYSYSKQETYEQQVITGYYPNGFPIYSTEYDTRTVNPYQSLGGMLIFLGVIIGIGTGLSSLQSRSRMKKML